MGRSELKAVYACRNLAECTERLHQAGTSAHPRHEADASCRAFRWPLAAVPDMPAALGPPAMLVKCTDATAATQQCSLLSCAGSGSH